MALIKCGECGKEISDKATTCPHCGAPTSITASGNAPAWYTAAATTSEKKKPEGGFNKILIASGIGFLILLPFVLLTPSKPSSSSPPADPVGEARFQKTAMFAAGLKSKLRDPESFVLESAHADETATVICIEYRARNGFGGMNKEFIVAAKNKVSQEASAWNKHCTKPLIDMMHIEYALK